MNTQRHASDTKSGRRGPWCTKTGTGDHGATSACAAWATMASAPEATRTMPWTPAKGGTSTGSVPAAATASDMASTAARTPRLSMGPSGSRGDTRSGVGVEGGRDALGLGLGEQPVDLGVVGGRRLVDQHDRD